MSSTSQKRLTALDRAVAALRQLSLATAQAGDRLGSEKDLMADLGVSRLILRQSAAILAQDCLVRVSRGANGGYFAARPTTAVIARTVAQYLQSRAESVRDVIHAVGPIRTELARRISVEGNDDARLSVSDFLGNQHYGRSEAYSFRDFLRDERAFGALLADHGGNALLSLFLGVLYEIAAQTNPDEDVFSRHPERRIQYAQQRNRIAKAILDGDEDLAVLSANRCTRLVADWRSLDTTETGP